MTAGRDLFGDFDRLYGEDGLGPRPEDPKLQTRLPEVEPFFFGPEDRLYGCLHGPDSPNGVGVVLCNAVGHELYRSHRSYHVLAHRLALAGQTVLRFDYRGTGDSQGDYDTGSLSAWVEDTVTAIDELRSRAGVSEIRLVGRRLGAMIAFYAGQREEIARLALWDAVVRGRDYFAELRELHDRFYSDYHTRVSLSLRDIEQRGTQENEFLGSGFSNRCLGEVEAADISTAQRPPAHALLWLESGRTWLGGEFLERFRGAGAVVDLVHSPDEATWDYSGLILQTVPVAVLDALVAWSCREDLVA